MLIEGMTGGSAAGVSSGGEGLTEAASRRGRGLRRVLGRRLGRGRWWWRKVAAAGGVVAIFGWVLGARNGRRVVTGFNGDEGGGG